jgi:hypothetical protein
MANGIRENGIMFGSVSRDGNQALDIQLNGLKSVGENLLAGGIVTENIRRLADLAILFFAASCACGAVDVVRRDRSEIEKNTDRLAIGDIEGFGSVCQTDKGNRMCTTEGFVRLGVENALEHMRNEEKDGKHLSHQVFEWRDRRKARGVAVESAE